MQQIGPSLCTRGRGREGSSGSIRNSVHPAELSRSLQSFGSSSKHAEIGTGSLGIVVCRSVGTVQCMFGLVWHRFRPKSGSKSNISGRILKSCRGLLAQPSGTFGFGFTHTLAVSADPRRLACKTSEAYIKGIPKLCFGQVIFGGLGHPGKKPHIAGRGCFFGFAAFGGKAIQSLFS